MNSNGDGFFEIIMLYIFVGVMTAFACWPSPENWAMEQDSGGEAIAIGAFWPLFAIKYLLIGIWYLISTGFMLLVGA